MFVPDKLTQKFDEHHFMAVELSYGARWPMVPEGAELFREVYFFGQVRCLRSVGNATLTYPVVPLPQTSTSYFDKFRVKS